MPAGIKIDRPDGTEIFNSETDLPTQIVGTMYGQILTNPAVMGSWQSNHIPLITSDYLWMMVHTQPAIVSTQESTTQRFYPVYYEFALNPGSNPSYQYRLSYISGFPYFGTFSFVQTPTFFLIRQPLTT